eukprot:280756_1
MAQWQQHNFSQQRNHNGYRQPQVQNNYIQHHGPPKPVQPIQLKRQASDLKSYYPDTKWCAVYLNTNTQQASSDWNDDQKVDVSAPIPTTNIYIPMDLEENIIAEVQMYMDEEKEVQENLAKKKSEIEQKKQQQENEKNEKVDTFLTFTSMTDRKKAREILEKNEWDLEKAAASQFSSSPNIYGGGGGGPGGGGGAPDEGGAYQQPPNNQSKAVIRMILPDNRQYTYQMDGNDTFWGVYGRLLQSVPELASKAFSLELSNGHILNENEFDQTLTHASLVPRGE